MSILSFLSLQRIFDNKLLSDPTSYYGNYGDTTSTSIVRREPIYSTTTKTTIFHFLGVNNDDNPNNNDSTRTSYYQIDLIPPQIDFHIQVFVLILLQIIMSHILSIIIYYYIIVPRKQYYYDKKMMQQEKQKHGPTQNEESFTTTTMNSTSSTNIHFILIGFGIVIPLALYFPFFLINYVDLRSRILRMGSMAYPVNITLRCLEAMFTPDYDNNYEKERSITNNNTNSTTSSTTSTTATNSKQRNKLLKIKSLYHYFYYTGFLFLPKYNNDNNYHTDDDTNNQHGINHYNKNMNKMNTSTTTTNAILQPITIRTYLRLLSDFAFWMFIASLAYTILLPYRYKPLFYCTNNNRDNHHHPHPSVYPTFALSELYDNFIVANLLYLAFRVMVGGMALISAIIVQYQLDFNVFIGHPIYQSISPSDFWSKRWNLIIHHGLKEGIYKPTISFLSNNDNNTNEKKTKNNKPRNVLIAKMITFAASGLMHEYILALIFYKNYYEILEGDNCETCYNQTVYGKNTIFFVWNGILLVLEDLLGTYFTPLKKYLPTFVISHFIVLSALPVTHLFTDDYLYGGVFDTLIHAFPLLVIKKVA